MPSISTCTTSPGSIRPTPSGVPVRMTSPGSSVVKEETKDTSSAIPRTMFAVVELWRSMVWPPRVTVVRICRSEASSTLKCVTTHGPSGQKVSKPLALPHWPSLFCRSRALTSLPQV